MPSKRAPAASARAAAAAAGRRPSDRKLPWRAEFARDLALRPTDTDAASGEVLAAQCGFCTAFGREPRVLPPPADGPDTELLHGRKKRRARTKNVAKWKTPFRTDHIRAHLADQHTQRWREYGELLARVKENAAMRSGVGGALAAGALGDADTKALAESLHSFFGRKEGPVGGWEPQEADNNERRVASEPDVPSVAGTSNVSTASTTTAANATTPLLLDEITTSAIVEALVDTLHCDSLACELTEVGGQDASRQQSVLRRESADNQSATGTRMRSPSGRTQKFVVEVEDRQGLAVVQRHLSLGLSFQQVAQALERGLTVSAIQDYARLSVAVSLQMIADMMQRSWTYAIALQVHHDRLSRAGSRNDVMQLCVRLPARGGAGADVADLHVVAVPLLSFVNSSEQMVSFVLTLLSTLDPDWSSKLLGGCVNGAASVLGSHATLLNRVLQHAEGSYRINRPAQTTEMCLRSALAALSDAETSCDSFTWQLETLASFLRGYEAWTRVQGRCPALDSGCPWSTLETLQWLASRRHAVMGLFQSESVDGEAVQLPVRGPQPAFWLVGLALVDVLSVFKTAMDILESFPLPSPVECVDLLTQCVEEITNKCKISGLAHDSSARMLEQQHVLRVEGDVLKLGRLYWEREAALVPYLRSLNLSTRRLYAELAVDERNHTARVLASFVLEALHSVSGALDQGALSREMYECSTTSMASSDSRNLSSKSLVRDSPPTLPLHFVALERTAVVDLVEQHSARLGHAHDLVFMDSISSEAERLRGMVASNKEFRLELEREQTRSFRCAWDCVPPEVHSLRSFAAGLATVLPRTKSESVGMAAGVRDMMMQALQARDEDQYRAGLGDLKTEAMLHMLQSQFVQQVYADSVLSQAVV